MYISPTFCFVSLYLKVHSERSGGIFANILKDFCLLRDYGLFFFFNTHPRCFLFGILRLAFFQNSDLRVVVCANLFAYNMLTATLDGNTKSLTSDKGLEDWMVYDET